MCVGGRREPIKRRISTVSGTSVVPGGRTGARVRAGLLDLVLQDDLSEGRRGPTDTVLNVGRWRGRVSHDQPRFLWGELCLTGKTSLFRDCNGHQTSRPPTCL